MKYTKLTIDKKTRELIMETAKSRGFVKMAPYIRHLVYEDARELKIGSSISNRQAPKIANTLPKSINENRNGE